MGKIDFNKEMFSVLAEGGKTSSEGDDTYQFPLWDILKEIGRRMRRAERDKSNSVRDYMSSHPDEVDRVRRKHGL